MFVQVRGKKKRMKLCGAALYWSVKKLVRDLASDTKAIEYAKACQDAMKTLELSN